MESSMLMLHPAAFADSQAFAIFTQLLQTGLLARTGRQTLGRSLVHGRQSTVTPGVLLLFLAAMLGLRKRRAGQRHGDYDGKSGFHIYPCASVRETSVR